MKDDYTTNSHCITWTHKQPEGVKASRGWGAGLLSLSFSTAPAMGWLWFAGRQNWSNRADQFHETDRLTHSSSVNSVVQRRRQNLGFVLATVQDGTGEKETVCFGSELGLFILTHRYRGLALIAIYREHAKRSASYTFNTLNRPLNLMTGTHNAHRQGCVGTTVKATTVEDRYGKPVNYAHFQGKRKQVHWSGHAPKIPAIFYSCPQINSSWESVHSDKSARCFTSEFSCIADLFVFMLKLKLGVGSFW